MGFLDKIKEKLKGKKSVQEGLDKGKKSAGDAIDKAAEQSGVTEVRIGLYFRSLWALKC